VIRPLRAHHATLEVSDVPSAVRFLTEVLGFVEVERHDIPGARAWAAGDRAFQVHLASTSDLQAAMGGAIEKMTGGATARQAGTRIVPHIAIEVADVEHARASLREKGIAFIDFGQVIFVGDPDGNVFELRPAEPAMTEDRGG